MLALPGQDAPPVLAAPPAAKVARAKPRAVPSQPVAAAPAPKKQRARAAAAAPHPPPAAPEVAPIAPPPAGIAVDPPKEDRSEARWLGICESYITNGIFDDIAARAELKHLTTINYKRHVSN